MINKYGILLAGWSANSKYAFMVSNGCVAANPSIKRLADLL